jgi:hypothetical protein
MSIHDFEVTTIGGKSQKPAGCHVKSLAVCSPR